MIAAGDVFRWSRTFTLDDIQQFGEISGDRGVHHIEPDDYGRLMTQGLLTATLPTKLGGDLNYIARTMSLEFLRPVFSGDTIACQMIAREVSSSEHRLTVTFDMVLVNQHGKEVMTGHSTGIIRIQ